MRTSIEIYNDDIDDFETLEVDVEYDATGKYYPETRDEPAEYPEIEVITVTTLDGKCLDFGLNQEQEQSIIDDCNNDLEDRCNDEDYN